MEYRFLRFPQGKIKAVTLSYDDGCFQDIRFAKLLDKYGLKGTFNLNSSWIGNQNTGRHYIVNGEKKPMRYMTADEIREHILKSGHEIALHGQHHKANGKLRSIEGIQEILNCRLAIEKEFGIIVRGLAYPDSGINHLCNGTTLESIKQYLSELDIAYARSLNSVSGGMDLITDPYCWNPTIFHLSPNMFAHIDKFLSYNPENVTSQRRLPKIFFFWGHTYEFDEKENWDYAEDICRKLSGKDDIWYATNIEICDYINAYNSLIYSADSKIVYNPTVKTVWFETVSHLYKIKPDETIKIN